MVKFIAWPKSIEHQLVKKLIQNWDEGVVADILRPCESQQHVIIAVCQDGRCSYKYDLNNIRKHFQTIFDHYSPGWRLSNLSVHMLDFSFMGDVAEMKAVLEKTHIFIMG